MARKRGSLTVSPDAIVSGMEYEIAGSGFAPGATINLSAATPGCCSALLAWADIDGEFTINMVAGLPGTYRFTAIVSEEKGKSGKARLVVHDTIEFPVNDAS